MPSRNNCLTATKYGYFPTTQPGVVVTDGGNAVQDFVLTVAPLVTITGNVRDASGGNWPLYAKIVITTARGPILTVFTDPATGNYSIPLVTSTLYNFNVTAVSPGYQPTSGAVTALGPGRPGADRRLRQGQLKVVTDTPYRVAPVPVDFTVRFLDVPDSNIFETRIYAAAGRG